VSQNALHFEGEMEGIGSLSRKIINRSERFHLRTSSAKSAKNVRDLPTARQRDVNEEGIPAQHL